MILFVGQTIHKSDHQISIDFSARSDILNSMINSDQQFLRISYGNEDKLEDTMLMDFPSSKAVAEYLRKVADRIEKYENSKKYRASEECVLRTEE